MRSLTISFIAAFLILIIGVSVATVKLSGQSSLLALHFDEYRGIDFFGHKNDVFGILIAGTVIVAINAFLAAAVSQRFRLAAIVLASGSILLSLLLFIAVLVIVANN